ncbi:MAG: glycosyltransferase [Alphaproteobacteria bacterium]|nr:glycosyltransferase [Alphaproteobacteria bacterium]
MSVRNAAPYLDSAIQSIRDQCWMDFEFLICDDGSEDDSAAIIRRHAQRDSRIRPFFEATRGLVPSLELLLSQARAPLIARMDGDDIAHVDRFALQLRFLAAHPDHVLVGSQLRLIDANGNILPISRAAAPLCHEEIMARSTGPAIFQSSVIFRRKAVENAGGYRRAYIYCEDLDLWLRLGRLGKFANLPEALIDYRIHPLQASQAHRLTQLVNAKIALLMDRRVRAGLPDVTEGLSQLPALEALDIWLEEPGLADAIRSECVHALLYEPVPLAKSGLSFVEHYIRHSPATDHHQIWMGILRLARAREYKAAGQLIRAAISRIAPCSDAQPR